MMTQPNIAKPPVGHAEQLKNIRVRLGLTQSQMADRLGLKLRGYQELEADVTTPRIAYVLAAEHVGLEEAVNRGDPDLAPPNVAYLTSELHKLKRR